MLQSVCYPGDSRTIVLCVFLLRFLFFVGCPELIQGDQTQDVIKPAECETMRISTSSPIEYPSTPEKAYYLLAFEPGGMATTSLVGLDASSLHWQVRHPAGENIISLHTARNAIACSAPISCSRLPTPPRARRLPRHVLRRSPDATYRNP
jgi:hypothetical protein